MENNRPIVIRNSSDFLRIKNSGKRRTTSGWLSLAFIKNSEGRLRYGYTITKKIGNAVVRNRLKRWCREYFFRIYSESGLNPEMDVNVLFKPMPSDFYKKLNHAEFIQALDKAFQSLIKLDD
ncbi:MAG: ribonuclease P protein component [Proteobacteria bacterium]|nr:ribonuclease P protein component [Pseudomonadota bacterium]